MPPSGERKNATMQNHERMKQKTHYSEALAYLRDYCLRHGRLMHFSHGDIFEAEGAAARLFGYIESGSFHYLVRNYEGDESTVETVTAGDLVGCYPYCLDGDAAPVTIRDGKVVVMPHEYGTYTFKNGIYSEMGRPASELKMTDKTHFRGRWKNRNDSWVKHPQMPDKVVRYIVDRCKTKETPSDVQQLIKQSMFK